MIKKTLEDFENSLIKDTVSGCWNSPYKNVNKYIRNDEGNIVYLIFEIFKRYGKVYKGKIVRSCHNKKCFNPEHLQSFSDEDRFWNGVNKKSEDECWEWRQSTIGNPYGVIKYCKKDYSPSRVSWIIHFGAIPDGLYVCHKCDNPPCCNPKHLFLGTHQDNVDDREQKGRNKLPYSKGEDHGMHKLTEQEVIQIRKDYVFRKSSYRKLSKVYKVSWEEIRKVIKRQTWSWLESSERIR